MSGMYHFFAISSLVETVPVQFPARILSLPSRRSFQVSRITLAVPVTLLPRGPQVFHSGHSLLTMLYTKFPVPGLAASIDPVKKAGHSS